VGKGGYSSNGKIVSAELLPLLAKLHCHLANLQNRITEIFDAFMIYYIKNKNKIVVRSSPDPPIFKKIVVRSNPDPAKIGFSPDPVLIRAHL